VGVEGARFGLTETKLGLTPATISPYVVARMGAAKARRVFMSSRLFDAAEARDLNLLARVVAPDDLDAAIEAEVVPYLSCAPGAVADAKALVRSLGPRIESDIVDATIRALVARWESPEAIEGITAFFDKRAPGWIG
jgi:methylglutaconyl-CoA hydratase